MSLRPSIAHMALVLLLVETMPAGALDKGYARVFRLMGSDIRGADGGDVALVLALLVAVVLSLVLGARFYTRRRVPGMKPARSRRHVKKSGMTFAQRAKSAGLKGHEVRNLWKISTKLSPKMPQTLLATTTGMQYLKRDLAARIRRCEKEAEMLKGILGKLEHGEGRFFLDRETARVSTDMQVWLVKKPRPHEGEGGGVSRSEAEDFELGDVQQAQGQLLDLSEGGAAVRVNLALEEGDVVEIGSADSQIWLPPISADVVYTEAVDEAESDTAAEAEAETGDAEADAGVDADDQGGAGTGAGTDAEADAEALRLLVHLRFVNPPITDIRKAMHEIQTEQQDEDFEADEAGAQ